MVGSAIVRALQEQAYTNLILCPHNELDLTKQLEVEKFFKEEKPDCVILAAAKVGGIFANKTFPANFIYDNTMIEMNVIHSAFCCGVKKLMFLGSSCIYPKLAKQPITEDCLLTSSLEKTNEAYALAKISGLKYCEYLSYHYGVNYFSVMPCNLYGPNDTYDDKYGHVIPSLIYKFHNAKVNNLHEVVCWGNGSPLREFLYVDDLADLCVFLIRNYNKNDIINAGTGKEISIFELAKLIAYVIGYDGDITWDLTKPNGTKRKVLDISKINELGWKHKTSLLDGLKLTYKDFLAHNY